MIFDTYQDIKDSKNKDSRGFKNLLKSSRNPQQVGGEKRRGGLIVDGPYHMIVGRLCEPLHT